MSGGWLHGGEHSSASSRCTAGEGGHLLSSCMTFGVSTSGAGLMSLNSVVLILLKAGVEALSAGGLHLFPWREWVPGWSKHLLEDAAPSENLPSSLFLIEANCLFGVSSCCALETVFLFWHDPRGWFLAFDTTVGSATFFVRFGGWDWSFDLVWKTNEGNLHTLFFLDSWLQPSRMLVADWHFLLPRLTGGAAATETSNCGLTCKINTANKLQNRKLSLTIIIIALL